MVALILLLAWTLSAVGRQLGTAPYIVELMRGNLGPGFVPPVVFLVCVIISIATGSSWGTFAIMFPIVIPMAHALGGHLHPAIGAVLAGSVFGDHCSPISDTTILSSTGAGCDHVDHVKTQLPYAALNGVVSVVALLAAGVTGSWLVLPGAIAASAALIVLFARTKGARAQDR